VIPALTASLMRRPRHHTLIFHRVVRERDVMSPNEPTAAWFDRLIAMLAKTFETISLHEAVDRASAGKLSGRTVSVTFDDGYADNYTVALPILERHAVPATFFVASSFLDGGRMWNDSILETFRRLGDGKHDIDLPGVGRVELSDDASRRAAAIQTIAAWKHLPPDQRETNVDALSQQVEALPSDLMMTSDQLRALSASRYATIGGHTRSHPILAAIPEAEALQEITGGKKDLESILQEEIKLFAYPNGRSGEDYRQEHERMVGDAGFDAAVATDWGTLDAATDLYAIPRFTPWNTKLSRFAIDLARCHYGML